MEKKSEPKTQLIEIESDFDLKKIFYAVSKRAWILVATTALVMMVDIIYTNTRPILYKATTQIMIEIPVSSASAAKETQTTSIGQEDYFTSQYEIIKSKTIAQRVIKELNLATLPEFKKEEPETVFQKMVTVQPIRKSRLVNISIEYREPVLAATMANALAKAYIDQNVENMVFMSREVLKSLPDEAELSAQISGQESPQKTTQQENVELLPSIINNSVLQGLRMEKAKINSEIAGLSKRYKEKHPKMIAANTRLKTINEQMLEQTRNVLKSLKAELSGHLRANNIRIVDSAQIPRRPSSPNKSKNMLLGLMLSLALGGGIIYLLEKLDDTLKTQEDVQKHLRLPFFGDFPFLKEMSQFTNSLEKFEYIDKDLHASTAIREIRTSLTFAVEKNASQTITITSSVPQEGKSFFAAYLAFSFAKNGVKTLLMDADLRLPVLHRSFNISQNPGLANLLSESIAPDTAIVSTGLPNLFLLPAGTTHADPTELFGTPKMRELIEILSKEFGKIIIDAPPSLLIPDAMVLSKVSNGTILVIRAGLLPAKTLISIKDKFDIIGSTIMGFVLNATRFGRHKYYDDHYRRYYRGPAGSRKSKKEIIGIKTLLLSQLLPKILVAIQMFLSPKLWPEILSRVRSKVDGIRLKSITLKTNAMDFLKHYYNSFHQKPRDHNAPTSQGKKNKTGTSKTSPASNA